MLSKEIPFIVRREGREALRYVTGHIDADGDAVATKVAPADDLSSAERQEAEDYLAQAIGNDLMLWGYGCSSAVMQ